MIMLIIVVIIIPGGASPAKRPLQDFSSSFAAGATIRAESNRRGDGRG
jgi:hypothetical protein